jgi:hypothetical protein
MSERALRARLAKVEAALVKVQRLEHQYTAVAQHGTLRCFLRSATRCRTLAVNRGGARALRP